MGVKLEEDETKAVLLSNLPSKYDNSLYTTFSYSSVRFDLVA